MSTRNVPGLNRLRSGVSEDWSHYFFVLPVLIVIALTLWLPFFRGIVLSFFNWPLLGEPKWVGLENYREFLTSNNFVVSLRMTLILMATTVAHLLIGLAATLAVYHTSRFTNVISTGFLLAFVIPPVASGTIMYYFLEPNFGPVFNYFIEFGILDSKIYWRQETIPAISVVTGSLIWTYWPWVFLILLAKRQSVPEELYESAKIYGASKWQMFSNITLPHMKGAILFVIVFRVILNSTKVAQNWQLTRGGPGFDTSPLALALFRFAFENQQMGRASAVGVLMVILAVLIVGPLMWWFERTTNDQEVTA